MTWMHECMYVLGKRVIPSECHWMALRVILKTPIHPERECAWKSRVRVLKRRHTDRHSEARVSVKPCNQWARTTWWPGTPICPSKVPGAWHTTKNFLWMDVPSLETMRFFSETQTSSGTTARAESGEGRCSGPGHVSASGSEFRGCPPPAHGTHPDALHHGDVLVLVRLEGDPAGAGGPAHGSCFCPRRVPAWTREHVRTHAHTCAWKPRNPSLARREQGHDPKKQGEGAGPKSPPPPVTCQE